MRHQKKTVKLGRTQGHRDALLANLAVSLIEHEQIKTTLAKAKAVRPFAERLLTLGKTGTLHSRRLALGYLRHNEDAVKKLFGEIAPRSASRKGGYTRIIKLGQRRSDASEMALIEWVDRAPAESDDAPATTEAVKAAKPAKEPKAKAKAKKAEPAAEKSAEKPADATE